MNTVVVVPRRHRRQGREGKGRKLYRGSIYTIVSVGREYTYTMDWMGDNKKLEIFCL